MRDVVVTNINQERYDALILQVPAKPLPTCDKVVVGCVVPLKDVTYCKNLLNNERMKNCTLRPRLCMEDLRLIWSLSRNELKPGLLSRSCERWENNFRVFRALITESQSYFERSERVKRFIVVTVPLAPGVGSPNFAERELLCGPHLAELSRNKELDLSSTERKLQREKIIFIKSINQCTWLQRFVRIVHSWPFVASRAVFLRKGTEGNICPVKRNGNYK